MALRHVCRSSPRPNPVTRASQSGWLKLLIYLGPSTTSAFFASTITHQINTSTVQPQFNAVNYSTQTPIGVAGLISPWNLPLYLLTFKIAPALAAGNTVVAKPSEMTSVTAWMMCKVFQEAGLPAGVCNVVFGTGAVTGQALTSHPDVPVISFTGGTATAEVIRRTIAPFNKKVSLELGGKNPSVVFEDANLDECVATHLRSCFANQGEICLCTSRVFVQDTIYDQFVEKFVAATRTLTVGDPKAAGTKVGALISAEHRDKVKSYIEIGRKDGRVLCGEGVDAPVQLPEGLQKGYYVQPTVIVDCPDSSRCMQEEIFGPVACISKFHSQEEVIERANGVKYGLAACVWSRDISRVHTVAHELHAGTVWTNCWMVRDLNMPFGGMKASGTGREGFKDSMEFFTESKTICIKM
eukprot:scpid63350/ scgid22159/ Aldehyde dehydrogenase family 8 member A1; Retinal dehydrogenase 4